jgi:hypothetical protein
MLQLARAAARVMPLVEKMCTDAAKDDDVTVEEHMGMLKALACIQDVAGLEPGLDAMSTSKSMQ